MQATVLTYDPETGGGSVVRDDGSALDFDVEALRGTGLRFLRPGQRVRLELSGPAESPRIVRLQILTLH